MSIVYVPYTTSEKQLAKLDQELDFERMYNSAWSGDDLEVKFDDTPWIDTEDEHEGTMLLHNLVYRVLGYKGPLYTHPKTGETLPLLDWWDEFECTEMELWFGHEAPWPEKWDSVLIKVSD